jgi:hypothetical protein
LFDFDPVPLITKAIVNVIQRDYTLAPRYIPSPCPPP